MAEATACATVPSAATDAAEAAAARYASAVDAADMDPVHAALAMSVWEPQAAIPPKRVRRMNDMRLTCWFLPSLCGMDAAAVSLAKPAFAAVFSLGHE
jgi:hypothetical protein